MNAKSVVFAAGMTAMAFDCIGAKSISKEHCFDPSTTLPPIVKVAAPKAVDPAFKTPARSSLFERRTDPKSGVPYYVLKAKLLAHNQQSVYFTHKSMTDDGRFILFWCADDEFAPQQEGVRRRRPHWLGIVDFKTDQVHAYEDCFPWIPFLDTDTDQMYYIDKRGIFRRDLLVDPAKDVKLCEIPEALKAEGKKIRNFCTHLTLNKARTHAFLDSRVDDKFVQGVVDLRDGSYKKWGEADFFLNHGQINPVDDSLALCAWEVHWTDANGVKHNIPRPTKDNPDVVYPRLQLIGDGWRQMVPSKKINFWATHERWDEQGEGFYWCADNGRMNGVFYNDLATGRQTKISPVGAHAMMSADRRYVVSDKAVGVWYRGCVWSTYFFNRETQKGVYINSRIENYATGDRQSSLHPDPHPQFVCCDRYMIWTLNSPAPDAHMDLAIALTSEVAAFCK